MKKPSVIIDYTKLPENEIDNFSQIVYNSLNPNLAFTWEATVMPTFLASILSYRKSLETAQTGNSKDVVAKNIAKDIVTDKLRILGKEVNRQANFDLLKLRSSGLELAKEPTKKGILAKPTGFQVKSGDNSGDLLFSVDANSDADIYNFYSAPVPATVNLIDWRLTPVTTRKKNISGYTPGKQYELKCAYKGTADALIYSDSIFIFAQ